MSKESGYLILKQHYEGKLEQYGDSHLGVDWPDKDDADTRYRIMTELWPAGQHVSVTDFGCGLSHFFEYLQGNDIAANYCGVDISGDFIAASHKKYPANRYIHADILTSPAALPVSDYLVANGVFTEKLSMSHEEMWKWVQQMLSILFSKVEKGIACNFMSCNVEWERDDLFHLSLDKLTNFITAKLGRSFVIRNDYGLYEFTVYIYRE